VVALADLVALKGDPGRADVEVDAVLGAGLDDRARTRLRRTQATIVRVEFVRPVTGIDHVDAEFADA
jgi:hypothetical protein